METFAYVWWNILELEPRPKNEFIYVLSTPYQHSLKRIIHNIFSNSVDGAEFLGVQYSTCGITLGIKAWGFAAFCVSDFERLRCSICTEGFAYGIYDR